MNIEQEEKIVEVMWTLDHGNPGCTCAETGQDGTYKHTQFSGWVIRGEHIPLHFITPCKNHIQNFLRHETILRRAIKLSVEDEKK